jgi:hypothetical protein
MAIQAYSLNESRTMDTQHTMTHSTLSCVPDSRANTRIPGRLLWVAWISLLALTVLNLIIYIEGIPAYFAWFNSFHTTNCLDGCFTPATVHALRALGISNTAYAVYWVMINLLFVLTYFTVAVLIFWNKPYDWMAWLASFSLVALGGAFPSIPGALVAAHPGWSLLVTIVGEDVLGFPSLIIFFFLFPTGHFVPRWTRWIAFGFAALFLPVAFFPGALSSASIWPGLLFISMPLVVLGSLVFAQVYRYRHVSTPIERQQTKWIVFGTAVALLGFLLIGYLLPTILKPFTPVQNLGPLPSVILVTSIYLLLLLIPLSIAVAILRYRLWDVDVIINKTLVYGLLTAILALIYFVSVFALQAIFSVLTGHLSSGVQSPIVIVASTLGIAALFHPLRRRLQALIDKRFYRSKYDAARTIAAFSKTLSNEVDLNQLKEDLLAVIQETMQPSHVSLWLRNTESSRGRNTRVLPEIDEELKNLLQ